MSELTSSRQSDPAGLPGCDDVTGPDTPTRERVRPVYFSSKRMDVPTPRATFAAMHAEFGFTIDVCASPENALLDRYWTEADECLLRSWVGERVWMNPPYGRHTARFMEKAWNEAPGAEVIVALVASRTDTPWWHDYAMKADEIRFVRGRLWFEDTGQRWAFPSAFVIWRSASVSLSAPV